MNTILSTYNNHITDIYETIDSRQDPTEKIKRMQFALRNQIKKYLDTINQTKDLFLKWNKNRYVVPSHNGMKGMTDEDFLESVVEHRIQSIIRFQTFFTNRDLDINDFIHLRNDTAKSFPGVYDNDRLSIYSLYIAGVCTPNDITITIFNDPTTSGFAELAKRRINQLKLAESKSEYENLISTYKA